MHPALEREHFYPHSETTPRQAARFLGRAITTLVITPPHLRIYRDLQEENLAAQTSVPLHPSIESVSHDTGQILGHLATTRGTELSGPDITTSAGLLMQFGNHFSEIPPHLRIPYATVAELYDATTDQARHLGRLSLSQQLTLALEQTDGDLGASLRHLFLTSRMYARWLDEKTIEGLPLTSIDERRDLMRTWQDSLLGFKSGDNIYHDTAGDTYYAWTHAYSGYMFESLSPRRQTLDRLARLAFYNGTLIMQSLVNNFNPRGTISDHSIAAKYGNAIADACNDTARTLPA